MRRQTRLGGAEGGRDGYNEQEAATHSTTTSRLVVCDGLRFVAVTQAREDAGASDRAAKQPRRY